MWQFTRLWSSRLSGNGDLYISFVLHSLLPSCFSIAKAGITTTLNSRCSVLAAANSVFGRWDDSKGDENIDFMPTILSRFDAIFVVKDIYDSVKDTVRRPSRHEV